MTLAETLPDTFADTPRVADLRRRVWSAMAKPPVTWACPPRIDDQYMSEPIPLRKARAIAAKLAAMPTDLWAGQLFAGSMTLEDPRIHGEWGFPDYLTPDERQDGERKNLGTWCFGHIVPDYPRLLSDGLRGIQSRARNQIPLCNTPRKKPSSTPSSSPPTVSSPSPIASPIAAPRKLKPPPPTAPPSSTTCPPTSAKSPPAPPKPSGKPSKPSGSSI